MQVEEYMGVFLVVNTEFGCLQTTYDDDVDLSVPVLPSTAASMNHMARSTCHGGQMPHPLSPCQQSPETSSSPTRSVSRSQSAPQPGKQRKRKGAIDWCSCSNVHTCQVHKAQANFRKSLRRGFLSPLAAQSSGEQHVSPFEAGGGHPALTSSLAGNTMHTSRSTSCSLKMLLIPCQLVLTLRFHQAWVVACNSCSSLLQLHMNCRQRTHGGRVLWRCKPFRLRLSETRLTC